LESIKVGIDPEGDEITSMVVKSAERKPAPQENTKLAELTDNQRTMLAILAEAKAAGLTTDAWNELGRAQEIGKKRRAALWDIRGVLKAKQLVRQFGGLWVAAQYVQEELFRKNQED
jgi:hypothetical protein